MKHLLTISFCLFALISAAADYTYNSYPITTRTYKKLFKRFKTKLFVLSDGKVICPIGPSGKAKKISFSKKQFDGEISGKVLKIIDKNIFTLKAKEATVINNIGSVVVNKRTGRKLYKFASSGGSFVLRDNPTYSTIKYYTVAISSSDASNLFDGDTFTANVISSGAYVDKASGQRMRKFDMLRPITKPEFKKYLDDGNKLYTYIKRLSGYVKCEKCGGRGHLPNPKNQNRRKGRMREPDLNCPDCKYGKIPVYKYTKILIKTKRKRLASR